MNNQIIIFKKRKRKAENSRLCQLYGITFRPRRFSRHAVCSSKLEITDFRWVEQFWFGVFFCGAGIKLGKRLPAFACLHLGFFFCRHVLAHIGSPLLQRRGDRVVGIVNFVEVPTRDSRNFDTCFEQPVVLEEKKIKKN